MAGQKNSYTDEAAPGINCNYFWNILAYLDIFRQSQTYSDKAGYTMKYYILLYEILY